MSVTQTVEILANRRLHLDFDIPKDIPIGKARVEHKIIPFAKKPNNSGKLRFSKMKILIDTNIAFNKLLKQPDFFAGFIPAVTTEQFIETITQL